jgi:hypothetical protein
MLKEMTIFFYYYYFSLFWAEPYKNVIKFVANAEPLSRKIVLRHAYVQGVGVSFKNLGGQIKK